MVFEPLRFGHPINAQTMNRFWTKVWQDNFGSIGGTFEMKFARMWHQEAIILNGSALTKLAVGADNIGRFPYHRYYAQIPSAVNDSFENYFTLDAGTYDFIVLCRTGSNQGIIAWQVDGVGIGSTDLYAASGLEYGQKSIVGVTISRNGQHILTGTVSSKHASSSAYNATMYKYCFREQ
jgi:hypothetical protein